MKPLISRYKTQFSDKDFVFSVIVSVVFLIASFILNFYAGNYATEIASSPVKDAILSNIPVFDVDILFVYGTLSLWVFASLIMLHDPKKLPFILKSLALFIVVRSIFITLTHIGPFPDQILIDPNYSRSADLVTKFSFGGDLFFSGHTGAPFLLALIFWQNKKLRYVFTLAALFFGTIVLLGHMHYTIDVLSAFFITYTIYHLCVYFFPKDKKYFDQLPVEKIDLQFNKKSLL